MNIYQWINSIKIYKISKNIIYNDIILILEYVFKKDKFWILSNIFMKIDKFKLYFLNLLLMKRLKGEPIAYIIKKGFFGFICYDIYPDIFIPRYDTEIMVEYAINLIKLNNFSTILELGLGSGIISLSIAKFCSKTFVTGVDINLMSVNLSKYNAYKLNINNVFFLQSNWFSFLGKKKTKFDLIISNPPYINKDSISLNIFNDLFFESYDSLVSAHCGVEDIKIIIKNSFNYLNNKGWLIIEHSSEHIDIVNYFFSKKFYNIFNYKDYNNLYRFTVGQRIF